jgi:hypothetical protein
MRRLLPALCAWLLVAHAHAQEPAAVPERGGYAFDYPRVLAQQRLFGIAHGIELLAGACRAELDGEAIEAAYALWRVSQEAAISDATKDLGEYYFGDPAATSQVVTQKLALKDTLDLAPGSDELRAACASLPAALQQQRYDLAERFRLEELMARTVAATEIEARERRCRPLFSPQLLELHDARYALWREINQPLLTEATAKLAQAWPADGPADSFDEWYADLKRRTQAGGSLADCIAFSESLKRPENALRNVFRMPPPLKSQADPQ